MTDGNNEMTIVETGFERLIGLPVEPAVPGTDGQVIWSVEDVALAAKKLEFEISPPLTIDEGMALAGLLNHTHPVTKLEHDIRWEIVTSKEHAERGDDNGRFISLNWLLRQLQN